MITQEGTKHKNSIDNYKNNNGNNTRLERYRVPFPLIGDLLDCCY